MKFHRAMTMFVIASTAALAMGCVDGVKLSSMQEEIHNKADEIHDRAYRCAPRELALASAHEEFGRMELSYGNGRRGEDHITFADEQVKEADRLALNYYAQDP